jgi:DNA-binding CsgD family transcriptional regulator/tetratricopeptide (TPR) repeat protein
MGLPLLERDHELAVLTGAVEEAARGNGSVVLVQGEAGIGKSSLVAALRDRLGDRSRFLVGRCDDLALPRILGPFRDLVGAVGPELTAALRDPGDRDQILTALQADLSSSRRPTVLAVEDLHWAEEPTLDVLRFLVRRVDRMPVVLLLTYRDDELRHTHPLHQLLGFAAGDVTTHRLTLQRLSETAVARLSVAADANADAAEVFRVTSGNPFFVHEVLTSGSGIPPTVVDAVLARLSGLDAPERQAVEQLSVIPTAIERRLVDALVPGGLPALAPAEECGLITVTPHQVTFRHELTRRAVEDALPVTRRAALDRRVLEVLTSHPASDVTRIVYHAARAGDREALVAHGPTAARAAAAAGAHRQASGIYRLLMHGGNQEFGPAERAEFLEQAALECYLIGDEDRCSAGHLREAVALRRQLGDPLALGTTMRWLSRALWWSGDPSAAEASALESTAVLAGAGDDRLLALAYSNQSQLAMLADRTTTAIDLAQRAIALAGPSGDACVLSHALNNLGSARWRAGDPSGRRDLEKSLRIALDAGEVEDACRAYAALAWRLLDDLAPAEAVVYTADGIALAERAEHTGFLQYLTVEQGMVALAGAHWAEAIAAAQVGLNASDTVRCPALILVNRARLRSGRADPDSIEETWELAQALGELQRTGPAAALLCEEAWLRDDVDRIHAVAGPVRAEAVRRGVPALEAELGLWLVRAGESVDLTGSPPDNPHTLLAAGRWREAQQAWTARGYPYEAAAARSESPSAVEQLAALSDLDALGAVPLGQRLRRRLRSRGVSVPRGPAVSTRENPGGLTARQAEVLGLLADGLSNADIANRLVVSVRTAGNHVAAVLEKLDVHSREEAVARGRELGM